MKLSKPLLILCEECQETIEINTDLDCISSDERPMGTEYEYEGFVDDKCPICGNTININLHVWEYPVGAVNYQEEEITGAEILESPTYNPLNFDSYDF